MRKLVLLLIITGWFYAAEGYGQISFREIREESEWKQAVADAGRDGKLLFLDIYATWCGPCKYLESNVYTDSALGAYYNANYINLKMDGESPFGRTMVQKFQLTAYPTMYYLSPEEEIITKIVGVREAGPLQQTGMAIFENAERLAYYEESFINNKLNAMELKSYQTLLAQTGQPEKAAEVAGRIIPSLSEEDIFNPDYRNIILNSSTDIDGNVFRAMLNNREKLHETWSPEETDRLFAGIFNATLFKAISAKDEALLQRIQDEFLPFYLGGNPAEIQSGVFITKKLYMANTDDWERYGQIVLSEYENHHLKDHTFLYREAYEVGNEYNREPEAVKLAIDWMKMAEEINPSFDNLALLSFLYGMHGEYSEARSILERLRSMELGEDQVKVLEEISRILESAEKG
ncbi:MAG: thioredoxin family protein [Bacteroidales bacterium]|nr:thioredoxin family protein [Bacteroidales bacterium]